MMNSRDGFGMFTMEHVTVFLHRLGYNMNTIWLAVSGE